MLKRYFLTLFWSILLLVVYLVSLLPLFVVKAKLDAPTFLLALCIWGVLAAVSFIPLLSLLIKKIWFFRGEGVPVTQEMLEERLLAINAIACPVQVISKRKKLIVTWRYQETQWCELFSRLDISRIYELHCRFEPSTRTVLLADRIRSADFLICPEKVKIGFPRIPLPFLRGQTGRHAAVDRYATLEAHEYDFHPKEIKSPVMGTILASGWNVRFSLF
jgi:hypothetical protein